MRHLALLLAAAVLAAASVPLSVPEPAQAWENGLARTPPMGWNQWNAFGCNVTDALVRATADRSSRRACATPATPTSTSTTAG